MELVLNAAGKCFYECANTTTVETSDRIPYQCVPNVHTFNPSVTSGTATVVAGNITPDIESADENLCIFSVLLPHIKDMLTTSECTSVGLSLFQSSESNSSQITPGIDKQKCGALVLALLKECPSVGNNDSELSRINSLLSFSNEQLSCDEAYVESLLQNPFCVSFVRHALEVSCESLLVGIPFTITFSSIAKELMVSSENADTSTVVLRVDCPDGQVAVGFSCRATLCPGGYTKNGGQCVLITNVPASNQTECLSVLVTLNSSDYIQLTNDTVLYGNRAHAVVGYNSKAQPIICLNNSVIGDPINCSSGLIALNDSEFTSLSNDTILFEGEMYDVIEYDDDGRAIICPPNATTIFRNSTTFSYPVGYFILTYIGCSLSVVGCALVLLTYGLFKSLRTLPSLILMNLATAILANNLLIIVGGPVTEAFPSVELCTTVAVCLHFFFLAQFTWMSLMSFQMARTFYQAKKLISATEHKKCIFLIYFILGWSIPLLITTVSIIVDFTTDSLVSYGVLSNGRLGSCWINHAESAIVAFIVPLVLTMIINLTLFIVVTVLLCLAARSSKKLDKKHNHPFFRLNLAVFSVTGLTWIFGFIALLAGTGWAWYPFIIFNSTQGFVIFIAFLFTKRVLKLYMNLVLCRKDTVPSTSNKHLSSQNSAHKISEV